MPVLGRRAATCGCEYSLVMTKRDGVDSSAVCNACTAYSVDGLWDWDWRSDAGMQKCIEFDGPNTKESADATIPIGD